MGRTTKQGIDYFSLDCEWDDKHQMYVLEKGSTGIGVLITIWQMIYSNNGYYIDNNNDFRILVKSKIDSNINDVSDCINACIGRNIFNKDLHEKYGILTSSAIQKRYFDAAKKKKKVVICKDYIINGIDSYHNWIDADGNATKEKEKEKEKGKEKEKTETIKHPIMKSFELSETNQSWLDSNGIPKQLQEEIVRDFVDYWVLDESKKSDKGWQQAFRRNPVVDRKIKNFKFQNRDTRPSRPESKPFPGSKK